MKAMGRSNSWHQELSTLKLADDTANAIRKGFTLLAASS
jgi:hypothetical protein